METLNTILMLLVAIFCCPEYCFDGAVEVQVRTKKLMKVTAYCPCPKCCGKYADGYTASGHRIQKGDKFVAADSSIPFDTLVSIPGYNKSYPVRVLVRGGAIKGNRLDVFFDSHDEALEWGIRNIEVVVWEIQ